MRARQPRHVPGRETGRANPAPLERLARCFGLVLILAATWVEPASAGQSPAERGKYLARAGNCMSCHTVKGGVPFAGGGRVDTPFGYMLSPNITPDPGTGIGRWTSDDFYRALHSGVEKNGQDMFPTMPYDFYTRLRRADVDAIYAYLNTLKPVNNPVDVNHLDFPFNMRWAAGAWREMYFHEGTYVKNPTRSAEWNRGAYLVEAAGHCSDCHTPRNLLGAIEKGRDLSGALVDGWFAMNLTSDIVTGLGSWSEKDVATYLKTGHAPDGTTAQGPMAPVIRDSTSYLTDEDLASMAAYLKSIPPDSTLRTGRVAPSPERQRGAQLYTDNCSGCHKSQGRGVKGVFPALIGNEEVLAANPANVIQVIDKGIRSGPGHPGMPAFGSRLNAGQVAEIANYVRSNWGNEAAKNATPEMVTKLREENAK
ncbi:MAG: c-type cytochrome [Lysobacterales bacterium]